MRSWRIFLGLGLVALLPARVCADQAEEIAKVHIEAMGGRARVVALSALRAKGRVNTAGVEVRFAMLAARPNSLRLEAEQGTRKLVQGCDGETPPWELEAHGATPRSREMAPESARVFQNDAEFDDPLIDPEGRKFSIDYAGEGEADGRAVLKVLVTRGGSPPFFLLLDAETYFIVRRVEKRRGAGEREIEVVTKFGDFRPVAGVLLPHRVTVLADGRVTQDTFFESVEANPKVEKGLFSRPPPWQAEWQR